MMILLLFFALLFHVNVTVSHYGLTNLAYSKKISLSSVYSSHSYPGSKAVNGLLTDFTATSAEKFPWMVMDLGGSFEIHEIEVFARYHCCGKFFH